MCMYVYMCTCACMYIYVGTGIYVYRMFSFVQVLDYTGFEVRVNRSHNMLFFDYLGIQIKTSKTMLDGRVKVGIFLSSIYLLAIMYMVFFDCPGKEVREVLSCLYFFYYINIVTYKVDTYTKFELRCILFCYIMLLNTKKLKQPSVREKSKCIFKYKTKLDNIELL